MHVELKKFTALSDSERCAWDGFQQAQPALDSPYFRPEFTDCVDHVRDDVEVAVLSDDAGLAGFFPFQRTTPRYGRPVGGRLSDYQAVIARPGFVCGPEVLLRGCRLTVWDFDHLLASQTEFTKFHRLTDLSPAIDISAGLAVYRAGLRATAQREMKQTERKARRLAAEIAPLQFDADSQDEEAFEAMLAWKSAQYRRTGITDIFTFPWTVALLREIRRRRGERFAGMLSVLRCGERPIAVHFGMRSGSVLHLWFPAYDPEFARFSPGRILLLEILRSAPDLGIRKIDLGRGVAEYKSRLMSQAVTVAEGAIDLRPVARRLRTAWLDAKDRLRSSPLHAPARVPARMFHRLRDWWVFR